MSESAGIKTLAEVAATLGRSVRGVQIKAHELGVSFNRRGENHPKVRQPDSAVELARTLYWSQQWTSRRIGEHLGVSHQTIYGWVSGASRTGAKP